MLECLKVQKCRNIYFPSLNTSRHFLDFFDTLRLHRSNGCNRFDKGNNGLTKRKYITFGIEADDLRTAKMRLERIETDVLANFKTLGVQARSLNGLERLELLHSQLHPDGQEKFHFQWSDLPKTGLSTKDFISPSGLSFSKDGKTFRVGDHYGAVC